jgi:O-acetyl-ADP-ribose deacetylase
MTRIKHISFPGSIQFDWDSRDYEGAACLAEEISEDIEDVVQSCGKNRKPNFFLNNPVNTVSIGQILDFIIHVTKENHITEWTIFTSRKKIYDFLSERIFPETGQSNSFTLGDRTIRLTGTDICKVKCHAIVNASNTRLILGAGVSGMIHKKAGPELQQHMNSLSRTIKMKDGDVALTSSCRLDTCQFIIHAATAKGSVSSVQLATRNALELCREKGFKSVCLPALGTGTGGMALDQCAHIMMQEILAFNLRYNASEAPEIIIFSVFSKKAFDVFSSQARDLMAC